MAKHIGFRNHSGTVDHICASDAEKSAFVAVDTALKRGVTYVEVSDADWDKVNENQEGVSLVDGNLSWDGVATDGSFDISQELMQREVDRSIEVINQWLESPNAQIVDNTIVAAWQNYKSELEALDLSSKTWPMNGTYVMAGLVGNGITEFKHLQRLP